MVNLRNFNGTMIPYSMAERARGLFCDVVTLSMQKDVSEISRNFSNNSIRPNKNIMDRYKLIVKEKGEFVVKGLHTLPEAILIVIFL